MEKKTQYIYLLIIKSNVSVGTLQARPLLDLALEKSQAAQIQHKLRTQ